MKKSLFFVIDIIWTFIVSSIIWCLILVNLSFGFSNASLNTLSGIIILLGGLVYLALTVCYIILGFRKVKGWRWWMSIFVILISAAMGFAGIYAAVYGSEFVGRLLV